MRAEGEAGNKASWLALLANYTALPNTLEETESRLTLVLPNVHVCLQFVRTVRHIDGVFNHLDFRRL